jgi:hypothetical protein
VKFIAVGRLGVQSGLCWLLLSWLPLAPVLAADWQGTLSDGSRIEVDASTHRAWRRAGNRVEPLWDGVHHLEDGSTVIVRHGTAVPTQPMLEAWLSPPAAQARVAASACDDLIARVCGANARCATSQPCALAHQLADMAAEASANGMHADARIKADDQCRAALANPFFARCE